LDKVLAVEFGLCIENEFGLYPQRRAVEKALLKRMEKGTYDAAKAPKLWLYWVTEGARWFAREHGVRVPKDVREYVALGLAQRFEVECDMQAGVCA
jgi:hypothetical protein